MMTTVERSFTASSSSSRSQPKLRWFILALTCLVLVLNYADRAALGVSGPAIIKQFGFTQTEFGLISSFFFIGYAPFCFIGGWLSDRYGPRAVMGAAVGWWSIFTASTAACTGLLSFLFARVMFGIGEGPQGVLTVKTMRNWFPQRRMGTAVGIGQGATPLGGAIGTPLVASLIAATGDWRTPFLVLGAIGLIITALWWTMVRDTPAVHPWASAADKEDVDFADPAASESVDASDIPPLRPFLLKPIVLATAIAFFAYGWVLFTFLSWFPVYLVEAQGLQLKQVAIAGSLPWLLGVVGFVFGGMVTDWIASKTAKPIVVRKWAIVIGLTATAIMLACIGFVTSMAGAVMLMSGIVFLLYTTGSQYFTLVSDSVPSSRVGGVVGFVHTIANISGLAAPVIVGMIMDRTHSWTLAFGLSGAICIVGVLTLVVFGRTSDTQVASTVGRA
jgi:MFS transporter, ACS family, hexuronate transporter